MKKTLFSLLTILFFCVICLNTACQPYQYYGKHPELHSVFVCSIPGTGGRYAHPRDLKIIETDSYGRTLFKHDQFEQFYPTDFALCGYVICQHYDGENAYYLRDVSFEIDKSFDNITEDRIEALKERCNWEQPLDLASEGMAKTWVFTSFRYFGEHDHALTESAIEQSIINTIEKELDHTDFAFDDFLYVNVYEIYDDERAFCIVSGKTRSCILAFYSDGTLYEGSPLWIDDPYSAEYIELLVKFRAEFEAAAAIDD